MYMKGLSKRNNRNRLRRGRVYGLECPNCLTFHVLKPNTDATQCQCERCETKYTLKYFLGALMITEVE